MLKMKILKSDIYSNALIFYAALRQSSEHLRNGMFYCDVIIITLQNDVSQQNKK